MNQADHDRRSLALHQRVCARLQGDAALIGEALNILHRWMAMDGPRADSATARWHALAVAGDVDRIATAACEMGEHGDQLRQSSPLSCLLRPCERWAFLREWKAADGA